MTPSTCSAQKTGGQQEEGHEVVHHVQGEHHQTYLLQTPLSKCQHPGWTYSVQDGPKVSHVDKDMVEQSHNTP